MKKLMDAGTQAKAINMPPDTLLDEVLYLAELASDPKAIDPLLDSLRLITAHKNLTRAISPQDRVELVTIHEQLIQYLIQKDLLRNFTRQELEAKIARKFGFSKQGLLMRMPWLAFVAACAASIGASSAAYALGARSPSALRGSIAGLVFLSTLYACIPFFFLRGLKGFKQELRKAYYFICVSIGIVGVTTLQYPLIQSFSALQHSPWFSYGGLTLGYTIDCLFVYLGISQFARILSIKSRLLSWWIVGGLSLATIALTPFLPHPAPAAERFFFDLPIICLYLCVVYQVIVVLLGKKIIKSLTGRYARPMKWYVLTNALSAYGSLQYGTWLLLTGRANGTGALIATSPFIFIGFFFLQSGYAFYKSSKDL